MKLLFFYTANISHVFQHCKRLFGVFLCEAVTFAELQRKTRNGLIATKPQTESEVILVPEALFQ